MAWAPWLLAIPFVACWSLALLVFLLRRLVYSQHRSVPAVPNGPATLLEHAQSSAANDAPDMPVLPVDNGGPHPQRPVLTEAERKARQNDIWWRLSDYCESLAEPKTPKEKVMAGLYVHLVSEEYRKPTFHEDGHGGMLTGVVNLRFWLEYVSKRTMVTLLVAPLLISLVLTSHAWLPWLTGATRSETLVNRGNTDMYEWLTVVNTKRAVPYCEHYDKARDVNVDETRLLLAMDMLTDYGPHARCILRLPPQEGSEKQVWRIDNASATLIDMTRRDSVAKVLRRTASTDARPTTNSTHMKPYLYVLRDGERYLRVTVRNADNTGFEPRLVREQDLLQLLAKWQHDIAESTLHVNLHYCMCPAFLGILDNMTFFFDTTRNQWEIWLQPRVKSANVLTALLPRRMKYSEKIAAFPYYQNQEILDLLPDPNGHLVTHYDTVHVEYASPARVQFPDDLDTRERFWMGHGTIKRTHEAGNPFALTVPLAAMTQVKLITGADSVCYHHCQHITELLTAAM